MKELIKNYHHSVISLIDSIAASSDQGDNSTAYDGVEIACNIITKGSKVLFIGNGGSAAIAGHMAIDFWKNGKMQAMAFNDGPLLTCVSNDYGYQNVFEKPIEMFANPNDVLVAISSSGKSENILRGVEAARTKGCSIITLSGFTKDNPLRSSGNVNFYVPSMEYGPVEVLHQYICHWILDTLISANNAAKGE